MAEADGTVGCELAYARPDRQFVIAMRLPAGATAKDALMEALRSGLGESCPEIDADSAVLGVFGRVVPGDRAVKEGDRVEVYRPLAADPRSARMKRVTAMTKGRKPR
jgi:putative ubiquitin-RnfH superfamily antitoxin RatB of RatAB toxin-antitoxin module